MQIFDSFEAVFCLTVFLMYLLLRNKRLTCSWNITIFSVAARDVKRLWDSTESTKLHACISSIP